MNNKVDMKLNKIGKILVIVGIIIFGLGIACDIIGTFKFGHATLDYDVNGFLGGYTLLSSSFFIIGAGVLTGIIGGVIILLSYLGNITDFANKNVVPTVQNGVEKITPTVDKLADSVKTGFNAAKDEWNKKD